jgi:uncharacterized membrane protein YesL
MNPFSINSPVIQFLAKVADMIILNILTLILSIPIVTIGAATTALHYAVDKVFAEEGTLLKNYFHAFVTNFKQSTVYWLLILLFSGCSAVVLMFMEANSFSAVTRILCLGCLVVCCFIFVWIFALQAVFQNTVFAMFRSAVICALSWPVRTILMSVLNLIPVIILMEIDGGLFLKLTPLWLGIWFSGCNCLCRWLLLVPMKQLKSNVTEAETRDEIPEA